MIQDDEGSPDQQKQPEPERIKGVKRKLLSNRWSRLESVTFDYRRSDCSWQRQEREIYHRGHGAAILLYNPERRSIVLIRQFRFAAFDSGDDGFMLEVPAGIVETEDPKKTIISETLEETGFVIENPQFLFRAYATPGSVTEQLHYFCAVYSSENRASQGGGLAAEGEDIEVLEVDLDDALAWVNKGKIIDAKTIVLILYAKLHLLAGAGAS
jgi:nudix-type nucleoside diphosphatase (YffH/AdpP family)